MLKRMIGKVLILGIIVLFVSASVITGIGVNVNKKSEMLSPLDDGLVGYWKFNEGSGNTAYDSSGNGNDGTINDANWTTGVNGTALEFDGDFDYVDFGDVNEVEGLSQMTVSVWMFTEEISFFECVLVKEDAWYLTIGDIINGDETIFVIHGNSGGSESQAVNYYLNSNIWSHVSVTYESGYVSLYINGILRDTASNKAMPSSNYPLSIAARKSNGIEWVGFFEGIIDEVRIYNRTLNLSEIQATYNEYTPPFVYVDDDYNESTPGWGYDHFDNIQNGIDIVKENGTVYVYNGTYYENVVIDKTINLIGEDKNTTVIDGGGSGDVVYVSADQVKISSFNIKGSGASGWNAGIHIVSDFNVITNNILRYNNEDGIKLWDSNHNNISDNNILNNGNDGIYIRGTDNQIFTNYIYLSGDDGIDNICSDRNMICNNNIISSLDDGLVFYQDCNNNTIINNVIMNNSYSIRIWNLGNDNNKIYHNNLLNNSQNAHDECYNTWNDSYPAGGNYWDDYTGEDNDGDGIGDTPYFIPGGGNEDRYPLMHPWGENLPVADFIYSVEESPVMFDALSSYDRDGEIVSYEWDFGDGATGTGEIVYHKYCDVGTYDVTLTVTDDDDLEGNITKCVDVVLANIPPEVEIYGPNRGKPGVEYEYVFIITDPDGDENFLYIDWGDGTYEDWMGPYGSGNPAKISHAWAEEGTYIIKAKVKDDCGESEWATFEVEIPRNRIIVNSLLLQLFERFLDAFPMMRYLFRFIAIFG